MYLDTTVPSALLDARAPERQKLTRQFWDSASNAYRLCVSELTAEEIEETPDPERRRQLWQLVEPLESLRVTDEAEQLADSYVVQGIFPEKYRSDALHLAVATVHGIRFVASWNFRHLVKVATRDRVNFANLTSGYAELDIVTPAQL